MGQQEAGQYEKSTGAEETHLADFSYSSGQFRVIKAIERMEEH